MDAFASLSREELVSLVQQQADRSLFLPQDILTLLALPKSHCPHPCSFMSPKTRAGHGVPDVFGKRLSGQCRQMLREAQTHPLATSA